MRGLLRCWRVVAAISVMSGCPGTHTSPSSMSGTWVITNACRQQLPHHLAGVAATVRLEQTGRFVADQMPCSLLGGHAATTCSVISGSGTWSVDDGANVKVELVFDSVQGSPSTRLPYGTQLHVGGGMSHTVLFYFDGDPDVARRIEFAKQPPQ